MVYCTKCGAQNPDDAGFCVKCGAELRLEREYWRSRRRRERGKCFGIPISGQIWGIIFGCVIVLWGLIELTGRSINIFALVAIFIGLVILISILRGRSKIIR